LCGIAGYYGKKNTALLKEMLYCIRHRGPDDEGIFQDDNIGLGIKRLAMVDEKKGHQPIYNEDKTLCIILNGEIYNYNEVTKSLKHQDHVFLTEGDTEAVIHAYEEWKEDCLQKLNGMFTFAIWDKKNKSLFIARDRLGIKPLYYYYDAKGFVFASEIKALLIDKDIISEPNNSAIYSYLVTGFQYTNETFFKNIKELQPGHYMVINSEGLKIRKYWDIPDEKTPETKEIRNTHSVDRSNINKFLTLLTDAINIRIPPNFPITYYLSGGIDSSAIVCLAEKLVKNKKSEESVVLTASYNTKWDEAVYAEEVNKLVRAKMTYVFPSSVASWKDLKEFVYYMDEPVAVLNYYVYWCLAKVTKTKSRIIFMGQGPDEFLAGHGEHFISYIKELVSEKKYAKILKELIPRRERCDIFNVLYALLGDFVLRSKSILIASLLDKKFLKLHKSPANTQSKPHYARARALRESLMWDVKQERLPMHLRVGDRMSSAFSIELRCPFLDHRIIEYSFTLPSNYKIRDGETKYIMREAVKGVIPESVRKRKKLGTPVPLETWLKKFRSEITQMIKSKKFKDRGYFNAEAVWDVYDRYCNNKMNRFEKPFYGDVLWRIINLELWFEAFAPAFTLR
jgi:asparagine synthase (glutamine-hydrolysing)